MPLEVKQTADGRDYLYCPRCKEAIGQPFKNADEYSAICLICKATTVHKNGACKVCGRNVSIPIHKQEAQNGVGKPPER
jgi:rRNA maturation endonuclease Nob1